MNEGALSIANGVRDEQADEIYDWHGDIKYFHLGLVPLSTTDSSSTGAIITGR